MINDISSSVSPSSSFKDNHSSCYVIPLREFLGMIGSYEWNQKGIYTPQIKNYIYPHYSVFVPTRNEYLNLLLQQPLPLPSTNTKGITMMDIGIGTGIITAMLVLLKDNHNKISHVIGTDINPNAISCTKDNLSRLGIYSNGVNNKMKMQLFQTSNIFPPPLPSTSTAIKAYNDDYNNCNDDNIEQKIFVQDKADLIICNPPWLPSSTLSSNKNNNKDNNDSIASKSLLDYAIYDSKDMHFLNKLLLNAKYYLNHEENSNSEIWLIVSNLSELLDILPSSSLNKKNSSVPSSSSIMQQMISNYGYEIIGITSTKPIHRRATMNKISINTTAKSSLKSKSLYKNADDYFPMISSARASEITSLYRLRPLE